jgi:hypothetical protein
MPAPNDTLQWYRICASAVPSAVYVLRNWTTRTRLMASGPALLSCIQERPSCPSAALDSPCSEIGRRLLCVLQIRRHGKRQKRQSLFGFHGILPPLLAGGSGRFSGARSVDHRRRSARQSGRTPAQCPVPRCVTEL